MRETMRIAHAVGSSIRSILVVAVLVLVVSPFVHAADEDLDAYKWRVAAFWWFSQPSGFFKGKAGSGTFDLHRDFGFGSYSTFSGGVDWHFKRKQHFLFGVSPVESTHTATLQRTITFQGETYDVGTRVSADIQSFSFSPGYEYDFVRRNWGYVGLATQMYVLNTKGTLTGAASVNAQTAVRSASGSVLAPLPVLGPRARWYPLHDSSRLALDGFVQGMYFFGYGDFYSAKATAGVGLNHNWKLTAGYQLGTFHGDNTGSNPVGDANQESIG